MPSPFKGPRPPTAIGVDSKLLASIGVQPEFVHSLADVLPDPDGGPTEGAAAGEPEPASASAGPGSAASGPHDSTLVFADAVRAAQRLDSIARPLSGGAVTHNYDARTMITALQFSQDLEPGVSLQVALRHAAPFFFDRETGPVVDALRDAALPQESRLRDARVRLDLLAIRWDRECCQSAAHWRYINPDSSPQLGWNWLIMREDLFTFPSIAPAAFAPVPEVLNVAFSSRTDVLGTLGRKRASLVKRTISVAGSS